MTDAEFDLFARAVNKLKADGTWVRIAKVHAASENQGYKTHMDYKTFLPWHRKFFIEVENRIQIAARQLGVTDMQACAVTIPYWNWALEGRDFPKAQIWGPTRLGALNSNVEDGDMDDRMCLQDGKFGAGSAARHAGSEFGKPGSQNPFVFEMFGKEGCDTWVRDPLSCREQLLGINNPMQISCPGGKCEAGQLSHMYGCGPNRNCSDCILRKGTFGYLRPPSLTYAQMVTSLTEDAAYEGIGNFEEMANYIENTLHNAVHGVIGGQIYQRKDQSFGRFAMGSAARVGHMQSFYSPYDPVFFFHHGFIDFLWAQWQDAHVSHKWRNSQDYRLNNLLWDGNADTFPTSDVTMNMDILDDDPRTGFVETACVKYHDRQSHHACADQWGAIQQCFTKLVQYQKLHAVPRIRVMTDVGDVCDPINKQHFDSDRMWLETMVASGMMQENQIDQVLAWERQQMERIENTTDVLDSRSATACDKTLCFSATKMLEICNDCTANGWSQTCHCSHASMASSSICWESRG